MSGAFDDNPFAPPPAPPTTSTVPAPNQDPFQTPTGMAPDESPFSTDNAKVPIGGGAPSGGVNEQPAVMKAETVGANDSQPQITTADFQRRQEELERRAKDLERREAELRNAPYNARANNWPPLPSFIPIQPCFYQDINVDIPVEFQKIVNNLYYLWVAHVSLLFANMIVGLFYLFAGGDWGGTFMYSAIYFVLFTPLSFMFWFRPAYKAFRDDSSVQFMVFFFVFFFQFIITAISAFGFMGNCGFVLGIENVTGEGASKIFVGVLMLLTATGFALAACADFWLLSRVHRLYKASGASFAKAQSEFTTGVMKNETVQAAAADAARETARGAFSAATTPSAGAGGQNR